ncbi:MAG TPA: hypothetical protein VGM14_29020 [Streptosporangiaceae bacterium]|jgi:hypothetical protein
MTKRGSPRFGALHAGQAVVLAIALTLPVGAWGTAHSPETATSAWGKAITLSLAPGAAGNSPNVMSCTSPGNCVAGGPATAFRTETAAWLVSQVHGVWGRAQAIRGLATSNGLKPLSSLSALSCPSTGNCVAVGSYRTEASHRQAFIVTQRHGAWGKAIAVPGLARLNKFMAGLTGVSCPSAGNCGATGFYQTRSRRTGVFLVSEVRGVWGHPVTPPGIAALPGEVPAKGLFFGLGIGPISCPAPGNCGVIGTYAIADGTYEMFVVNEVNSAWHKAIEIPGTARFSTLAPLLISCSSAGNCEAGGSLEGGASDEDDDDHAFVVRQVDGTWNKAIEVPGLARLDKADDSAVVSLSCSSAGNCGAAGFYASALPVSYPVEQAFVVNQVHGVWSKPIEVAGTGQLNTAGNAAVMAISCPATDRCSAGGFYQSKKSGLQTFAVSQP